MNNCNWCSVGEILKVCLLIFSFTHYWKNWFITCTKRSYATRMLLFLVNSVLKSQIFSIRDITKISSKFHQEALPITIFWVIFAGITLKKKFKKWGQHFLNPCSSLGSSLPSFVTDERKRFQCLNMSIK